MPACWPLQCLVVFLYGSMVWGLFASLQPDVSFESHISGALAEFFGAFVLSLACRSGQNTAGKRSPMNRRKARQMNMNRQDRFLAISMQIQ